MKNYNKKIMERITNLSEMGWFDKNFWQKAGVGARFSATWKMVDEFYKIKGAHGYKLRLQRSVQNIEQAQG